MREELMKQEIQEKKKEIGEQLRQSSFDSNPFDDMLYLATEILRNCLFDCSRFKNRELPENFRSNEESTERLVGRIMDIYSELNELSPEAAEVCRMTSGPMQNWEAFNEINDKLIRFEKKYDTVYSQYSPVVNEDFLIFKLGEDSEEYRHLLNLRNLTTTRFKNFTSNDFSKMMDVLDNSPDVCKKNFMMSEETFIRYKSAITEEKLSDKDIEYMKRWKELACNKKNIKTLKVRKESGEIVEVNLTDSYFKIKDKLIEILKNKGLFFQGTLSEETFLVTHRSIMKTSMEYMKYDDADPDLCVFINELIEDKNKKEYIPNNVHKVFQINQILSVFCPGYAKVEASGKYENSYTDYHFIYYR